MGGTVVSDLDESVTHIVTHRMSGLKIKNMSHQNKKTIYSQFWIEYCWKNVERHFSDGNETVALPVSLL